MRARLRLSGFGAALKILKLHRLSPVSLTDFGGLETGSTRVVKVKFVSGIVPPLSGFFINANDNVASVVAANDNGRIALAA